MAKKILVVDDEYDIRESVKTVLAHEGYVVRTAVNGEDFLKTVEKVKPDLVILDILMPGLTTKEILGKLKEKKGSYKIMFLSVVRVSDEEMENLKKLGNVVGYMTKPFDIDKLTGTVKKFF